MTKPIPVDGQRRLSIPLAVLLILGSVVAGASLTWGNVQNRINNTETKTTQLDVSVKINSDRLTHVEQRLDNDLSEIKTNVSWLKEREQARGH